MGGPWYQSRNLLPPEEIGELKPPNPPTGGAVQEG